MREKIFKINDYVVCFVKNAFGEARKNKDYAKIIELKKIGDNYIVDLQLLSLDEKTSCPLNQIRDIETSKFHLLNLGFEEKKLTKGALNYRKNDLVITHYLFGYWLGDIENIDDNEMKKYIIDDKWNVAKFFKNFPTLYNVNDLFNVIESNENCIIDREKIITSIPLI